MTQPDFQPFDLLGDPVPPNFKGRGAPPHMPTDEKRKIVKALWAQGRSNQFCAAALGISEPTFNKHYFKTGRQRAQRDTARAATEALMMQAVLRGVDEGNMAAVKQLRELMHRADLERLAKDIAHERAEGEPSETARALPKKQQQAKDAEELTGLYEPGPAPGAMVN